MEMEIINIQNLQTLKLTHFHTKLIVVSFPVIKITERTHLNNIVKRTL
jgi:hypothetical protein